MARKGTTRRSHSSTAAAKPAKLAVRTVRTARPAPARGRVRESDGDRRARARRILDQLHATYPDADCALRHRSALELLAATILSAQCTDERVNLVTPNLFARYPDVAALAAADSAELESLIRSTGFFRNKTRSLIGMAARILQHYSGSVPDRMDDLLTLPGVARKTANCVLGTWFRKNDGVVVDTHVGRLASRLALAPGARDDKDALRIEQDLMRLFPQDSWTYLSHALIQHGRQICTARKPQCARCPLAADCPSAEVLG